LIGKDVAPMRRAVLGLAGLMLLGPMTVLGQTGGGTKDLLGLKTDGALLKRVEPSHGAEKLAKASLSRDPAPGLDLTFEPGEAGFPGLVLKPEGTGTAWDLSKFGHVEATVVNTGSAPAFFALRVDNAGDYRQSPWNSENVTLKPGERQTVTVIFGHQYGHKPGYKLKPEAVVSVLMFTDKVKGGAKSFRVESLVAGGSAGETVAVSPDAVRIRPARGVLLGPEVAVDVAPQGGAKVSQAGGSLRIELAASKVERTVSVKPPKGRWDLTLATEIQAAVRNVGSSPVGLGLTAVSNGGPTQAEVAATVAPGAKATLVAPFAAATPGRGVAVTKAGHFGNQPGTGTSFTSDATGAVKLTVSPGAAATVEIDAITALAPPAELPDWLGKRPPVAGDWVVTFDEEFDKPTIDATHWNIYGPNYWDRASHWSKDNLILADGLATLRFEKKRGPHNDDPKTKPQNLTGQVESDYACGYLDTAGKWVQRYGYFESRVKLPRVPGLWPTFWMMPDRGPESPIRRDTGGGAMELDIMEHLTRWGPFRYNTALHWDGYKEQHKAVGTSCNYVAADRDGFITSGLLWLPGSITYYGNGRELWRWEGERVSNVPAHFIFEMTTGGWDNNAVDDATLPADYHVDYVRVWQRKDLASPADGLMKAAGR
jgi:beta-glucanase (GH16 family)